MIDFTVWVYGLIISASSLVDISNSNPSAHRRSGVELCLWMHTCLIRHPSDKILSSSVSVRAVFGPLDVSGESLYGASCPYIQYSVTSSVLQLSKPLRGLQDDWQVPSSSSR